MDVEVEQAPRGKLTLYGTRNSVRQEWIVPPGEWGLITSPVFDGRALHLYLEGRRLIDANDVEPGAAEWRRLARLVQPQGTTAAWVDWRLAGVFARAKRGAEAEATCESALRLLESEKNPAAAGHVALDCASMSHLTREHALARARQAAEYVSQTPHELQRASVLGWMAFWSPYEATAQQQSMQWLLEAHQIVQREAPASAQLAEALDDLGDLAYYRMHDVEKARLYYAEANDLWRKVDPGSVEFAFSVRNLAKVPWYLGDYETASKHVDRATALMEQLAPNSLDVANLYTWQALIAGKLWETMRSDSLARRAIAIHEATGSPAYGKARLFSYLADSALKRGDLHESTRLTRNSLEPCQREQDLDCVGVELHRLGDIALLGSQPLEAARLFRESLAAHERVTTDSASAAFSLACLARALADLRQFESAEDAAQRSLRIRRKLSPSHPDLADSWLALAELAVARKDWTTAEERARTAITGFERYSPENLRLATSSHILGLSLLGQGKQGQALEAFARAVAILEEQRGRGRASVEARAYFATGFAAYYRDYAEALVEAGREADAFHVLEQSRARALLDSLGLRELQFAGDLPDALARERAAQRAEYDRTLARLASLGGDADPAQVERLRGRLRELRDQAEEIGRRIREASPRVASFDEPQPLRLVEAQAALDPGTVLLVFSVHEQRTRLFVVRPPPAANDGLDVHAIAIGTDGLREKVEDFRRLIGRRDLGGRETLQAQAVELYDLILRPADAALASAERLLFVPDGPLHLLPFAALARTDPPGTEGGESQSSFLAEWQPVHIAASATTYSELRRLRPAESVPLSMVAFGDPKYPAMGSTDPATIPDQDLRRAVDRGFTFTPLPASRAEAQAVAALFAPGSALYLGEDATEERAKDLASKARYLHFATHGLLDERSPLDSAIALSMPETQEEGQDNGLLQAWEILDSVRIEADLATLSACDTARGREMGGEGLVGLTRAFQFAGARSVLASLWSVSDASTGRLMQRFYTNLKAGRSKDEALRLAQVDAIRSPDAHPFDWAAFQLFGDWR